MNTTEQQITLVDGIPYIPFAVAFHTLDIIPYFLDANANPCVIIGKKKNATNWVVIGGFLDPEKDDSPEAGALRELGEETNIHIKGVKLAYDFSCFNKKDILQYLGGTKINDERFEESPHKVITSLYAINIDQTEHDIKPQDDIVELKWAPLEWLISNYKDELSRKHHQLLERFFTYFYKPR
jgi:8-oxo-dGTP pyrophosphatase MutT (NUDIX family)